MRDHISLRPPTIDRDLLIEQHRSYVRALAVEIFESLLVHVDLNDLIAYGQLGLVEAAGRYDPRRGVTFPTFAHYRIKGAIYDGLREMGYHSRTAHGRMRFAAGSNDLLQTAADDERADISGRAQSIDDEIEAVQSTIDTLIPIFLLSLDTNSQMSSLLSREANAAARAEQNEMGELLRSLVAELPEEYRRVIVEIYFKDQSMIDLAAKLGVSRSWISRLHSRAVKHLRVSMEQRGLLGST